MDESLDEDCESDEEIYSGSEDEDEESLSTESAEDTVAQTKINQLRKTQPKVPVVLMKILEDLISVIQRTHRTILLKSIRVVCVIKRYLRRNQHCCATPAGIGVISCVVKLKMKNMMSSKPNMMLMNL